MKGLIPAGWVLLAVSICCNVMGQSPAQINSSPSLGELAKRMRAQRASRPRSGAPVYTNDNLPNADGVSVVGGTWQQGEDSRKVEGSSSSQAAPSVTEDERYFRNSMGELQASKNMHRRELAVLEQKLGQYEVRYYPDPWKGGEQEYSSSDISQTREEIEKKQQQIAADEQAIEDLWQQCRREECQPGWLREGQPAERTGRPNREPRRLSPAY